MAGTDTMNRSRSTKVESVCIEEPVFKAFLLLRGGLRLEEVKKQTGFSRSFIDMVVSPLAWSKERRSDEEIRELLNIRRDTYDKRNRVRSMNSCMQHRLQETEKNERVLRILQNMLQFRDDVLSEARRVRDGKICSRGNYSKDHQELVLGAACALKAIDNLRIREKDCGAVALLELITPLQACKRINANPTYFAKVIRSVDAELIKRNAIAYASKDIEMTCEELGRCCCEIGSVEKRLALGKAVEKEAKEMLLTRYAGGVNGNGAEIHEMQILTGSVAATAVIYAYKKHKEDDLVIVPLSRALKINRPQYARYRHDLGTKERDEAGD